MPRNQSDVYRDKLHRHKDQVARLEGQLRDARRAAGRTMLAALEGHHLNKSQMRELWSTSYGQVSEMIARAKYDATAPKTTTKPASSKVSPATKKTSSEPPTN